MPKFLVEASYSAEGLRGLAHDRASGREAAVREALAAVGGKLEGLYFALGEADVYALCDCPDHVTAAAVSLAVSASGLVKTRTIPLLTVAETDKALAIKLGYRAPGTSKAAKA